MITIQSLEERKDILESTLYSCEETLVSLKERAKIIKKEIENTRGAILELECLIGGIDHASN